MCKPSHAAVSLILLAPALTLAPTPVAGSDREIPPSVVKVFATQRAPDLFHPWAKQEAQQSSGSGVIIEGRRILTNAHVVQHSSQIFVQPFRSGDKIAATVRALAPDVDLAILTVDDATFFERYPPLARSSRLPGIKDTVHVFGYPMGGEAIAITRGVVSRIEFTDYYYTTRGLRVQIDAAINPGNSGGPAVVGDEIVGLAFSRLQNSDNIGYIIPCEEIELFLDDVADGRYDGKPEVADVLQAVENEALRRRLKLPPNVTGLLVWRPARDEPSYPLRPWDVITAIGGHPLDGSGMVKDDRGLHLFFTYYVQALARGGRVPLDVFREGKSVRVDLPVTPCMRQPRLLPYLGGNYPSYLIWGPLAFTTATQELIAGFGGRDMAERWFPYLVYNRSPLLSRGALDPRFEDEQLVVAAALIPHRLAKGYADPTSCVVDEVNGVKVRNLKHMTGLLRDARDEFVVISFRDHNPDVFVFDRKQVEAAADEILNEAGIRRPYSDDLKPVMEAKK